MSRLQKKTVDGIIYHRQRKEKYICMKKQPSLWRYQLNSYLLRFTRNLIINPDTMVSFCGQFVLSIPAFHSGRTALSSLACSSANSGLLPRFPSSGMLGLTCGMGGDMDVADGMLYATGERRLNWISTSAVSLRAAFGL